MKEIRRILAEYDSIDHEKEKAALATVVNVEASSYRRIGARMLVRSNGLWTGGISGGCLEGDALKRSKTAIFKNKPSRVVYDTMEDDSNQIGIGLGCNGRIEVVFTPIDPEDMNNPIEQLRKIVGLNQPAIQLQVIETVSADIFLGKSQVINSNIETIDFCNVDNDILKNAVKEVKSKQKSHIISTENREQNKLKILVEFHRPETRLVIIGDNYDVNAMVDIANELGWQIYLIGKKKKFGKHIFSSVQKVFDHSEAENIVIDNYTAVVLMSHDYNIDKSLLTKFIDEKPTYIGMLGPKKRMQKMQTELGQKDMDNISYFYSPVGLDIGAESPEEIALSIMAEIIAVFRNRKGSSLKFREGTIHERE